MTIDLLIPYRELNAYLSNLFVSVQKDTPSEEDKDNSKYERVTLKGMQSSFARYLKEHYHKWPFRWEPVNADNLNKREKGTHIKESSSHSRQATNVRQRTERHWVHPPQEHYTQLCGGYYVHVLERVQTKWITTWDEEDLRWTRDV
jgi:hypothetical protein